MFDEMKTKESKEVVTAMMAQKLCEVRSPCGSSENGTMAHVHFGGCRSAATVARVLQLCWFPPRARKGLVPSEMLLGWGSV